jgi:phosphoenolpyruvate-protein phosphotransferase (PTS system enzyme I)
MIKGIPASQGIGIGKALVYKDTEDFNKFAGRKINSAEIENEFKRFEEAVVTAGKYLENIKISAGQVLGKDELLLFEAYQILLHDPLLNEMVQTNVKIELLSAEAAVLAAVEKIHSMFSAIDNEYMKQRAEDVVNVGKHLLDALLGTGKMDLACLDNDTILIAEDLTPAETVTLDSKHIKGIVIEKGGVTSHTAIVARTLEIPAVVGCGQDIRNIFSGDNVVVDGTEGAVIVNPSAVEIGEYTEKFRIHTQKLREIKKLKCDPAVTTDGIRVELTGNIARPEEACAVLENGGDGIGLFRTEFLYLGRNQLPTEEEQFRAYRRVTEIMGNKPCIIRTMDIGGDKQPQNIDIPPETNPFLGYRAIRICLKEVGLFKTQLRAILRASAFGNLKIMFPMISGLEELQAAKKILAEVKLQMDQQTIPYDKNLQVGIMIETPAAAMIADILAAEADFFSIGTNDLCQYTLAVDRMNEKISYLYNPLHIGVLRLIKTVIEAGHKAGIKVGMCGEMASGIENAVILLGLGLNEFSMTASAIPHVKKMIRNISAKKAQEIATAVMKMTDTSLIPDYIKEQFHVD